MGGGAKCHSQGSEGRGLGLQEKQGTNAGEGEMRRGSTTMETSFSVHVRLLGGRAPLPLAIGGEGKLLQASHTPEVGMARHHQGSMNQHDLWAPVTSEVTAGEDTETEPLTALRPLLN